MIDSSDPPPRPPAPPRTGDETIEVPGREPTQGEDRTIEFESSRRPLSPAESTVPFDLVRRDDSPYALVDASERAPEPVPLPAATPTPVLPSARRLPTVVFVALAIATGLVAGGLIAFVHRPASVRAHRVGSGPERSPARAPVTIAARATPDSPVTPVVTVIPNSDAGAIARRSWPPPLLNPTAHLRTAWDLALGRPGSREVLFTFDDGPNPGTTDRLLGILDRFHVHAVFFVSGWRLEAEEPLRSRARAILRDEFQRGHVIGNHTVHHRNLAAARVEDVATEIDHNADLIHEVIGERPHLFRPPYGAYSADVQRLIVARGLELSLWSVDSHDWQRVGDAQGVAMNVITLLGNMAGGTVLLHDTHPWSVRAAQMVLQWLEGGNRPRPADPRPTYRVVDAAEFLVGARERLPLIQAEIAAAERERRHADRGAHAPTSDAGLPAADAGRPEAAPDAAASDAGNGVHAHDGGEPLARDAQGLRALDARVR